MAQFRVDLNTSAVDVALNLSGSIAGLPVLLAQLPVLDVSGLASNPPVWTDIPDTGSTWTPGLEGEMVDLTTPIFNPTAIAKRPFTTPLAAIEPAIVAGSQWLEDLMQ